MKLRNKKTGQEGNFIINKDHFECADLDYVPLYFSLSELLNEWEDCQPNEPLIKDEKIRKAVRAWAEACNVERCAYDGDGKFATRWHGITLDCSGEELEEGRYTITELCGEGKE